MQQFSCSSSQMVYIANCLYMNFDKTNVVVFPSAKKDRPNISVKLHGMLIAKVTSCSVCRISEGAIPSPFLPSPSLRSRPPFIQLGGLEERWKLSQRGLGRN